MKQKALKAAFPFSIAAGTVVYMLLLQLVF